jgi:hypothetical protein
MQLADDILDDLHASDGYELSPGEFVPWNEISLRAIAEREGLTEEEVSFFIDADWDVGEAGLTMASFDDIASEYVRYFALFALPGPHSMVRLIHNDTGLPAGFSLIAQTLIDQFVKKGGRLLMNTEVTTIMDGPQGKLNVFLKDGRVITADHVISDVGKRDLDRIANHVMRKAKPSFHAAAAQAQVIPLAKTYCYWPEAWWLQPIAGVGQLRGRGRTSNHIHNMRYHDGAVDCSNGDDATGEGCRGSFLVAYYIGSYSTSIPTDWADSWLRSADEAAEHHQILVNGELSPLQQAYWDDLLKQVRAGHDPMGVTFPDPDVCVTGLWHSDGPAIRHAPGPSTKETNRLLLKPVSNVPLYLVNQDFADVPGWSEGAVRAAERVLKHHFRLKKPDFLNQPYYDSVIVRLNGGG